MASETHDHQLHFVLYPLMAQGHKIPMIDAARLLAQRGVLITIVTTPRNADRFKYVVSRDTEYKLRIKFIELQLPCEEAGLFKGCDNLDLLPSMDLALNLFVAASILKDPVEKLLEELTPRPSCIISDMCFPWTTQISAKFRIPKIIYQAVSCFCLMCLGSLNFFNVLGSVTSDAEYFALPGLPDRIEFTKAQIPLPADPNFKDFTDQMVVAELVSYGVIVNTFEELEPAYITEYREAKRGKLWCIGPVSLCNKDKLDKIEREVIRPPLTNMNA